jgi:hypothetical protein
VAKYRDIFILLSSAISKGQDVKAIMKNTRASVDPQQAKNDSLNGTEHNNSAGGVNSTQSILIPNGKLASASDAAQINRTILLESNLCHQVAHVVINILSLILIHHKVN